MHQKQQYTETYILRYVSIPCVSAMSFLHDKSGPAIAVVYIVKESAEGSATETLTILFEKIALTIVLVSHTPLPLVEQ